MLTTELETTLERQQKRAIDIIFGFGTNYNEILGQNCMKTLKERRIDACNNFAVKLAESTRFGVLFPENEYPEETPNLRNMKKYREDFARTNRLYNSPLFSMRRYLNANFN